MKNSPDVDQSLPEGWTDDELVDEYREIKGKLVGHAGSTNEGRPPGQIIEGEMGRRGLLPDREDVIPEK